MRTHQRVGVAVIVMAAAAICLWTLGGARLQAAAQQSCPIPQSPRRLQSYNGTRPVSYVTQGPGDTIVYRPEGSTKAETLVRCGQHYHCWVENFQPECANAGMRPTVVQGPDRCPITAELGSWVEVHSVYAPRKHTNGCNWEKLDCCDGEPVVVIGNHAKVVAGGERIPPPVYWQGASAEWTGSNTGADEQPTDCKPVKAYWRFTLGCNLTVGQNSLSTFTYPDRARRLQPEDRLSHDLYHVTNTH